MLGPNFVSYLMTQLQQKARPFFIVRKVRREMTYPTHLFRSRMPIDNAVRFFSFSDLSQPPVLVFDRQHHLRQLHLL